MLDAEATAEGHVVTQEEHAAGSAVELHGVDLVAELHGVDLVAELLAVDSVAAATVAAVDTAKIRLRG
jgi:hypothetical protein